MFALLAVPLGLLLTVLVALALANLQHTQSTGFLGWLSSAASKALFVGKPLADLIIRLDKWMTHAIGRHYQQIESRAVKWISGLALYQKLMAATSLVWPAWLLATLTVLIHRIIPRRVKAQTDPIARTATHADATARVALRGVQDLERVGHKGAVAKTVPVIERVAMPHASEWDWIHHHWKALTEAVLSVGAPAIALPRPLAKALPWPFGTTPKQLFRRFRRVEALLGVTGFALIMARVLRIANPRCLSSGPIGKVARALCGMSSQALEDLLGLLVDVVLIANVCDAIDLLDLALKPFVPIVEGFVTVADAALCGGDFPAAPDDSSVALSLPPVTGLTLSLGSA